MFVRMTFNNELDSENKWRYGNEFWRWFEWTVVALGQNYLLTSLTKWIEKDFLFYFSIIFKFVIYMPTIVINFYTMFISAEYIH